MKLLGYSTYDSNIGTLSYITDIENLNIVLVFGNQKHYLILLLRKIKSLKGMHSMTRLKKYNEKPERLSRKMEKRLETASLLGQHDLLHDLTFLRINGQ